MKWKKIKGKEKCAAKKSRNTDKLLEKITCPQS